MKQRKGMLMQGARCLQGVVLGGLLLMVIPLVHAETRTILAEGSHTMGDNETPAFAEAQALSRAKQAALEQAGTYVESYVSIYNQKLSVEQMQTLAAGVMAIEVLETTRTMQGNGMVVTVKIQAKITMDQMEDMAKRIRGKAAEDELKKLKIEYNRLMNERDEAW